MLGRDTGDQGSQWDSRESLLQLLALWPPEAPVSGEQGTPCVLADRRVFPISLPGAIRGRRGQRKGFWGSAELRGLWEETSAMLPGALQTLKTPWQQESPGTGQPPQQTHGLLQSRPGDQPHISVTVSRAAGREAEVPP